MSIARRKVKIEGPGALNVLKRGKSDDRHFSVQNDHQHATGEWDDVYVEFSGYFGSYGPHVFAAAPDLLKVLKRIDAAMDFNGTCHPLFNGLQKQMQDAIAKAEGRS